MKEYSDEEIIKGIKAGGKELEKMVGHLYDRKDLTNLIVKVIKNHKGNFEDAQDVLQDGISQFVMNIRNNKYKAKSSLSTYLTGICKNLWFNIFRKKETAEKYKNNLTLTEESNDSPETTTFYKEQSILLSSILGKLGQDCKNILELWSLGYSMKEIAMRTKYANDNVVAKKKYQCQKKLTLFLKERPDIIKQLKEIRR